MLFQPDVSHLPVPACVRKPEGVPLVAGYHLEGADDAGARAHVGDVKAGRVGLPSRVSHSSEGTPGRCRVRRGQGSHRHQAGRCPVDGPTSRPRSAGTAEPLLRRARSARRPRRLRPTPRCSGTLPEDQQREARPLPAAPGSDRLRRSTAQDSPTCREYDLAVRATSRNSAEPSFTLRGRLGGCGGKGDDCMNTGKASAQRRPADSLGPHRRPRSARGRHRTDDREPGDG